MTSDNATLDTPTARLSALRALLAEQKLDGFLLPRADRHQGETVPACDERLAWTTGFTGSSGFALILSDRAAMVVDGRYELQAAGETDPTLFEVVPLAQHQDWVRQAVRKDARIGFDPWLMTVGAVNRWRELLKPLGAVLTPVGDNPIDTLWFDRPDPPSAPARAHDLAYAGQSAEEKRRAIAERLRADKIDAAALTLPDSIAWLLNIRGDDIPNTPVTLAFAIVDKFGAVQLFTTPEKFSPELRASLGNDVSIAGWSDFEPALRALQGRRVAVEQESAPQALADILQNGGAKNAAEIVWRQDPTSLPKARKNPVEIDGARAAQRRDGAALCETLHWIEKRVAEGGLTELEVAEELTRRRRAVAARLGSECVDESFSPIVGFGPNGAIVHYRVTPQSSLAIKGDGLLLLDSGGQYPDGTTDVTRTVAIGAPTAEMIEINTRVLKGMVSISRLRFPKGVAGRHIDTLARAALWEVGLDYDHGTGHGVGSFLGVHEGPQRISRVSGEALEEGMILSNEPGCYLANAFGVRIENLILVTGLEDVPPDAERSVTPERKMRRFETLTLAPIDRRLIDVSLLTGDERAWLDAYHAEVKASLSPLLDEPVLTWLEEACAPL